jgi:hypothetical protein
MEIGVTALDLADEELTVKKIQPRTKVVVENEDQVNGKRADRAQNAAPSVPQNGEKARTPGAVDVFVDRALENPDLRTVLEAWAK